MNKALRFLRRDEWTMGNGQCPECCGLAPDGRWKNHPCNHGVGHEMDCALAASIFDLGARPIYLHSDHVERPVDTGPSWLDRAILAQLHVGS